MGLPKVVIGVPFYRVVEGNMFQSALGMAFRCAGHMQVLPINCSGAYTESNRNGVVDYAMEIERTTEIRFDWLMWLDTDMTFPDDTPLRLIAHDKDIVGANYRTRTAPYECAGHYYDGQESHAEETGLVRMRHLPTGVLLIRFEVLRHMTRVNTEAAIQRMETYPAAIDRLRVIGFEQAARDLEERMSPFPDPCFRAPRNRKEPRDDVYFCWRAAELGYEIWCDMDLTRQVYHRSVQDIGWFDPGQIIHNRLSLDVNKAKEANDERARNTARDLTNTAERRGQARSDGISDPGARSAA